MGVIHKRLCKDTVRDTNLSHGVIVQRHIELSRDFEIHDGLDRFHSFLQSNHFQIACGMMALNEVIHGEVPQRLKLDLDIERSCAKHISPKDLICHVKDIIDKVSLELFGLRLDSSNWTLYHSHGDVKLSYHLVSLNHCVPSSSIAKEFAVRLVRESEILRNYLDLGVYKSVQFFRIVGTSKLQSELRFKEVVQHPWDTMPTRFECSHQLSAPPSRDVLRDSMVAHTKGLQMLHPRVALCIDVPPSHSTAASADCYPPSPMLRNLGDFTSLLRCCEMAMEKSSPLHRKVFSYSVTDSVVKLIRKTESHCLIHHRVHSNDNCIIYINPSKRKLEKSSSSPDREEYFMSMRCWRDWRECHDFSKSFGNI